MPELHNLGACYMAASRIRQSVCHKHCKGAPGGVVQGCSAGVSTHLFDNELCPCLLVSAWLTQMLMLMLSNKKVIKHLAQSQ